jgi:hypothetical protein
MIGRSRLYLALGGIAAHNPHSPNALLRSNAGALKLSLTGATSSIAEL